MKNIFVIVLLALSTVSFSQKIKTENVILVTFDGCRWQEIFTGADKKLIRDAAQVKDTAKLSRQYWAATPQQRRAQLMPFFWSTLAQQGMLIGDRKEGSRMSLTNLYKFSYPGYNEIFSGHKDPRIHTNEYGDNPNKNIFDFLAADKTFDHKIAAIANWDAFPKIINSHRNGVPVYVDFKCSSTGASCLDASYDTWQTTRPDVSSWSMKDTITYHFAKEYLHRNHPRFAFIGFDETDHFSHEGQYDAYLNTAHMFDAFMKDLWTMIQSDPQYKDKTTLIITCDHGRGHRGAKAWHHHGPFTTDSHQVWMAAIGPDTQPFGDIKKGKHYHTNQIAATIARFFGKDYKVDHHTGKPIDIVVTAK